MSNLTTKDAQIGVQVAAKIAADVVLRSYQGDEAPSIDRMVGDFVSTLDLVSEALLGKMGEQGVVAAFPGSTIGPDLAPVIQIPTPANQVAQAVAQHPSSQPAPIPGAGDETDLLWREYFADPSSFWDNRNDKRSPNSPDFAHKTKKNAKGYAAGLYLPENDRFKKNPSWVASALRGEQF